jgi:hypothetical protein
MSKIKAEDNVALKPGDVVIKVEITKTDNCGRDSGREGYDIRTHFKSGKTITQSDKWIHELDEEPNGIYTYDGESYAQIENWEA